MNDDFEQQLRRQSLRPIPTEWRAEVLVAMRAAQTTRPPAPSWFSTFRHQLSTIFWPHPKAWTGLAAVWVFIFILNFSMRDKTPMITEKSEPPSPEVMVELRQQKRLLAELMGTLQPVDADRQKIFSPKPRSERVEF